MNTIAAKNTPGVLKTTVELFLLFVIAIVVGYLTVRLFAYVYVDECRYYGGLTKLPHEWNVLDGCRVKLPSGEMVDPKQRPDLYHFNFKIHDL